MKALSTMYDCFSWTIALHKLISWQGVGNESGPRRWIVAAPNLMMKVQVQHVDGVCARKVENTKRNVAGPLQVFKQSDNFQV